jgi:hypothetical protein
MRLENVDSNEADTGDTNGRDPHTRFAAHAGRSGNLAAWHLRPGYTNHTRIRSSDPRDHRLRLLLHGYALRKGTRPSPVERRTAFFRATLAELARAIADGAKASSFDAWSLMDNFEWTDGYSQRYGLTYGDFRDEKRTVKDSGLWSARVAASSRSTPHIDQTLEMRMFGATAPRRVTRAYGAHRIALRCNTWLKCRKECPHEGLNLDCKQPTSP